ncbi:S-layer homology domain-containing protein [Paenibacillus ginsengarvi]|uniref:S-layer homology domain-containing protein n=1 Tax=Paenibacillus ginsengarvi TaxID=400777 RepID=A0A3B0CGU9_9BACL|nr:S-layer homology domain-containing protein [Paenibacillus ginsengarvi]RKN83944.1 S-layer homology domain-containing protein [Paenibacillus ginsengarvi]
MKSLKSRLAACVVYMLLLTLFVGIAPVSALADQVQHSGVTVISNDFIKVTVNNATGRFGIRTVEGQPIRKKDQNVNMLFGGDDPQTSFTTFRIDGTDYIFGNPYKFAADFFSEVTLPRIVNNTDGTRQIETVWSIKGIAIKQILKLYTDSADKQNAGNVNVRYEVANTTGADVEVGSRVLLDTMVAGNDGPAFQIGTSYKTPLMVERKLVHNPEDDPGIAERERPLYKLPPYWVMRDRLDLTNPLATNVIAYGLNNFSEGNINIVDEMIVGHWNRLANTKWDYTVDPNLDFTRDTNDYGTADSAVAFYWNPDRIPTGAMKSFETVYGLGEMIQPDKVFSIRYMDTVEQLATLDDGSAYKDEGIFNIIAEVENIQSFQMEHSYVDLELTLEGGLDFLQLDEKGQIVRDASGNALTTPYRSAGLTFRKEATPEEANNGIQPKYKPGDTITVSFKVKAKGRAWPSVKEYLLTAKSPETSRKVESVQDEGIKAEYTSSKGGFIFLPPVGTASPTYVYAMSPEEAYSKDEKYITLNMSNIEAYNVGSEQVAPNFDLFFKETITGKRYKVPVKDSVLIQPTDEGLTGDMRITYRGGDLVDEYGKVQTAGLGPELPLGQYRAEIRYKGGNDEEMSAMYSVVTPQTFLVTDNEKARIREAKILTVTKTTLDLRVNAVKDLVNPAAKLAEVNRAYPGYRVPDVGKLAADVTQFATFKTALVAASKGIDPTFDEKGLLDFEHVSAYRIETFQSEEELKRSKSGGDEMLVEIRGMIKQIGSGDKAEYVVDTKTEPAIINKTVAYKGKDIVFVKGQLEALGMSTSLPFLSTLFVKGDGDLTIYNSGFLFYRGEWTLDFFNSFNKTFRLSEEEQAAKDEAARQKIAEEKAKKAKENPEDSTLNGALKWAAGAARERMNPLRQVVLDKVYFNKYSMYATPGFSISGLSLALSDFLLREDGVSFAGTLNLKVVEPEIKDVLFNDKGFVGVDAALKFNLDKDMGLLGSQNKKTGEKDANGKDKVIKGEGTTGDVSGEVNVTHYVQKMPGISNKYGMKFQAELKNIATISAELGFKQVADGRVLPDVIAFGAEDMDPGILITGATYLTGVRGAIRELADTIAGGDGAVPLTVGAGVDIKFGIPPATFYGSIDLLLKMSGIRLEGKLDYSPSPTSERVEMLTMALIEAQWFTPWFVRAEAELDVFGWDVIIGNARIFVGQNLEKNRIDFEGFVGAKVQIPSDIPIIGGIPIGSVFMGLNNDKIWGGVGIGIGFLVIEVGITYYWSGDLEFGTSGEGLPEGLAYMQLQNGESRPKLVVVGEGIEPVATSWTAAEAGLHEIQYRSAGNGVTLLDNGSMDVGIGGITVSNDGKRHVLPMGSVTGNGLLEVEYYANQPPALIMQDNARGTQYPIVFYEAGAAVTQGTVAEKGHLPAYTQLIKGDPSQGTIDRRKAYVAIPKEVIQGGSWTLYADQSVQSKLLNIPLPPKLDEVKLTPDSSDSKLFQASWKASNAGSGDTISLYLTKDAVTGASETAKGGGGKSVEVPAVGDPGILIAKDLQVGGAGRGSTTIDVSRVPLLGGIEDIRGLLEQGDYYLRAELHSVASFSTRTSAEKFRIADPLAPDPVSQMKLTPAGNGYFELSFKPGAEKPGQAGYPRSYRIDAFREGAGGKLSAYSPFGTITLDEEGLRDYWNPSSGEYEHIRLGGWSAFSTSKQVDHSTLAGSSAEGLKYTGLEVGNEYVVGVTATVQPPKNVDPRENWHSAVRADSVRTLLPAPQKPKLISQAGVTDASGKSIKLLTPSTTQSIALVSDQTDVEVEAIYSDKTIASVQLANQGGGSSGTLNLNSFPTDGTYGIELKARNKHTGDYSITMLYLTVDTTAPVLYIASPKTGDRTSRGAVTVSGMTSSDAGLTVNGTRVEVQANGAFSGTVPVSGSEARMKLHFVAVDGAGNRNEADVDVTNDGFKAPVALILRTLPDMGVGEQKRVEAYLKYANGKDAAGKISYLEVPVAGEDLARLSFASYMGSAVQVAEDGTLQAIRSGSSIVSASYQVTEDVSLSSMTVVKVPNKLEVISATSSKIDNTGGKTKISVAGAGAMDEAELVYSVGAAAPKLNDDLSLWAALPADRIIPASDGNYVVIAKRSSEDKRALGASPRIAAQVWKPLAVGGGGGMGGMNAEASASINGKAVAGQLRDGVLTLPVSGKGLSGELHVVLNDKSAHTFIVNLDQHVRGDQAIRIDTTLASVMLSAGSLLQGTDGSRVRIAKNGELDVQGLRTVADELGARMLGDGLTFELPMKEDRYAAVRIPVDGVTAEELTAVILQDDDGSWTTVPWKLVVSGDQAYVEANLAGSGKLAFIGGSQSAFSDVADSFWGKNGIDEAAAKLLMVGREEGKFDPDSQVTRAEFATVLLRAAGLMNKTGSAPFSDVASDDWFWRSAAIASAKGMVQGFEDGTFRPDLRLTRLQAMVMAGRLLNYAGIGAALGSEEAENTLASFADRAALPEWGVADAALSVKYGVIEGTNAGLDAEGELTRAQAAAIAIRLEKLLTPK